MNDYPLRPSNLPRLIGYCADCGFSIVQGHDKCRKCGSTELTLWDEYPNSMLHSADDERQEKGGAILTVGCAIRDCREARSFTQKHLAQIIGISPAYLNDIEHNRRDLKGRPMLTRFADALGVQVEWLLFYAGLLPDVEPQAVTPEQITRAYQAFYRELGVVWPPRIHSESELPL